MNKRKRRNDIVRKLLESDLNRYDQKELLDMLVNKPMAIDPDKKEDKSRTFGDKVADQVTKIAGSWPFVIIFVSFLIIWMLSNYFEIIKIDPYPFILLNLILSCIAALQAPIIMMSQNRAAKKDSIRSLNDYKTDLKSELILELLHDKLEEIEAKEQEIINILAKKSPKKSRK